MQGLLRGGGYNRRVLGDIRERGRTPEKRLSHKGAEEEEEETEEGVRLSQPVVSGQQGWRQYCPACLG